MPPVITPQIPAAPPRGALNAPTVSRKNSPMLMISAIAIVGCLVIGMVRMFSAPRAQEDVQVVAAAVDLPAGCRIGYGNVHYLTIPKRYYKEGMYTSYEQLVGKIARTFIGGREPITNQVVISNDRGLSGELPKGYRAITLKLTNDASVDAQARPGDRVDVIVTSDYKSKKFTKTICENLLVMLSMPKEATLSARQQSEENTKVTVAASPSDAEILSQAMEQGKIRLSLRSLGDISKAALEGADQRDLLPADAMHEDPPVAKVEQDPPLAPMPPPPLPMAPDLSALPQVMQAPARWVVQMFSGSSRTLQEVEPTDSTR